MNTGAAAEYSNGVKGVQGSRPGVPKALQSGCDFSRPRSSMVMEVAVERSGSTERWSNVAESAADPQAASNARVVERILAGDREAYRLLIRQYRDVLYGHALRMTGEPDVAADLVQGSFVKGFEQLRHCRDPQRFGGWIFRILMNACRDWQRSELRHRRQLEHEGEWLVPRSSDPWQELERSDLRERLLRALSELPDKYREAFELKHVDGQSYTEMEKLTGVSIPALKMRVARAREMLKTLLQEVG